MGPIPTGRQTGCKLIPHGAAKPGSPKHVIMSEDTNMLRSHSAGSEIESLRKVFHDRGIICLKNLLPTAKVTSARKAVHKRMEQAGIWKNGEWQVDDLRHAALNEGAKFGRKLKGCPEFTQLVCGEIPTIVGQLLNEKRQLLARVSCERLVHLQHAAWRQSFH